MAKVFVYGTLKKGYNNNYLLSTSKYLGEYVTKDKFGMDSYVYYPAIFKTDSINKGYIVGELYEVEDHIMPYLDKLEGYPNHFDRQEIIVEDGGGNEEKALVYYYKNKPNNCIENKPDKNGFIEWK